MAKTDAAKVDELIRKRSEVYIRENLGSQIISIYENKDKQGASDLYKEYGELLLARDMVILIYLIRKEGYRKKIKNWLNSEETWLAESGYLDFFSVDMFYTNLGLMYLFVGDVPNAIRAYKKIGETYAKEAPAFGWSRSRQLRESSRKAFDTVNQLHEVLEIEDDKEREKSTEILLSELMDGYINGVKLCLIKEKEEHDAAKKYQREQLNKKEPESFISKIKNLFKGGKR